MATPRNLYDLVDFFELVIAGTTNEIDEPIGWDKVRIRGSRDKDFFGFNYEFVDAKTTLTFPPFQGYELIKDVYDTYGIDGVILFRYGYIEAGVKKIQFVGTVNLSDYNRGDDGVDVTIEKTIFSSKLRTRYETKVAMDAVKDADGNTITPPTPIDLQLHSKRIRKQAKAGAPTPNESVQTGPKTNPMINYIQADTSETLISEMEGMEGLPLGCTPEDPLAESRYQFSATANGAATIKWTASYNITAPDAPIIPGGPTYPSYVSQAYELKPIIWIRRAGTLVLTYSDPSTFQIYAGPAALFKITHSFSTQVNFDLHVGDQVFFHIYIKLTGGSIFRALVNDYAGSVAIEQVTELAASTAKAWRLWDVLNHIGKYITGRSNAFESSFFGPGGCGYNMLLTNGYQVRKFSVNDRPLQISLKDCFDGIRVIWCGGVQYSLTDAGQDVVKIEKAHRLLGARRMHDFRDVYEYGDFHAKDIVFNEVEIGYNKSPEDDINTLDEANTYQTWLMPVVTYKQKYIQKTNWIASGYMLEKIRREQFALNPSTSVTNDDDTFIISAVGNRKYTALSYSAINTGSRLRFDPTKVLLNAGDSITITNDTSGAPNNHTYLIVAKTNEALNEYQVSGAAVATGTGLITLQINTTGLVAERNEAFATVQNLISPESAYNLRLSVKRILYNHSRVLMSSLELKNPAEVIKNTFAKNNGELITQFSDAETCSGTELNYRLKENEEIRIGDFNEGKTMWMPRDSKFKSKISYRDLSAMKAKMIGQIGTADDYGTVSWPDLDGRYWEGYIMDFEYEPYKEEITLTCRKLKRIL